MRLTLRTLLAYLDDTLEPSQAKLIGQKVAESDTAQELIARIKQVTRRRRLTTPPDKGPGAKVDPNTVAEYLDNTLSPDQLAEVEQLCLASDVHLAEIAACHQILTLVLGEPALVPPTAKQRMYGLVKGKESIQFRKPAALPARDDDLPHEDRGVDETLRLGLPVPVKGRNSRLILIGGGAVIVLLLGFALWQLVASSTLPTNEPTSAGDHQPRAQLDPKRTPPGDKGAGAADRDKTPKDKKGAAADPKKDQAEVKPKDNKKDKDKTTQPEIKKKDKEKEPDPVENPDVASAVVRDVGLYEAPKVATSSVLLQLDPDSALWHRLGGTDKVKSGTPLVSLPGYRGDVKVGNVRLSLWGNFPTTFWKDLLNYNLGYEAAKQAERRADPKAITPPFPAAPLLESMAVVHQSKQFDLDVTLKRGRILIANAHKNKQPVRVRVRFDNPTNPKLPNVWDLELLPDSEAAVERWAFHPFGEQFEEDRKAPRAGPVAHVELYCLKGEARLKVDGMEQRLDAPPGFARVIWESRQAGSTRLKPLILEEPPEWVNAPPPATPRLDAKVVEQLKEATRSLANAFVKHSDHGDVVLGQALGADRVKAIFGVRGLAALNNDAGLGKLIDAMESDNKDVRLYAIDTLRYWAAQERDNDYRLYDLLTERYKKAGEAAIIMGLLHDYPKEARYRKSTYEALIGYLGSSQLALRELANWRLFEYVPNAEKQGYIPDSPLAQRRTAIERWQRLLDAGQLPPPEMREPGKEK